MTNKRKVEMVCDWVRRWWWWSGVWMGLGGRLCDRERERESEDSHTGARGFGAAFTPFTS